MIKTIDFKYCPSRYRWEWVGNPAHVPAFGYGSHEFVFICATGLSEILNIPVAGLVETMPTFTLGVSQMYKGGRPGWIKAKASWCVGNGVQRWFGDYNFPGIEDYDMYVAKGLRNWMKKEAHVLDGADFWFYIEYDL